MDSRESDAQPATDTPIPETLYDSYTDGGCQEQSGVSSRSKAGWGFFVQDAQGTPLVTMYGPVLTDRASPLFLRGKGWVQQYR